MFMKGYYALLTKTAKMILVPMGQSNSISIHVRSLQLLMTEMFKTKFALNPPFMKDILIERSIKCLRNGNDT